MAFSNAPIGSLPISGLEPRAFRLVADPGSLATTGSAASLAYTPGTPGIKYTLSLAPVAFTVTGSNRATTFGKKLLPGSFALTGSPATLTYRPRLNLTLVASPALFRVSGTGAGLLVPSQDEARSRGGFDPYAYKRRNKRRDKLEDVRQFMADVLGRDFEDAPEEVADKVEEAKQAALEALAVADTMLKAEAREKLAEALHEINEFYRVIREQVRKAREEDDEEDEELLLFS